MPCCHTQAYDLKAYDSKESSIKNGKIVQKRCSLARRGQAEATTAAVRLVVTVAVILCCSSSSTRVKLAVMAVTLCTVATIVISGRPAATPRPTDSYPVQIEVHGRTQVLTVGSHWTARDVTAALEAKTGRSLRGCWLLAPGGKVLRVGKKTRTLGELGVRKDSVLEVRHRVHGGMGCTGSKAVEPLDAQLQEATRPQEEYVDEVRGKLGKVMKRLGGRDGAAGSGKGAEASTSVALSEFKMPDFEYSTPMLVMPFLIFKAQGRIMKSVQKCTGRGARRTAREGARARRGAAARSRRAVRAAARA